MVVMYRILPALCLVICVLLSTLSNVRGCLSDPKSASKRFIFEALPSVNVSLGERLELRCTANSTSFLSQLSSMALLSRMSKQLNATCAVSANQGICSYVVENVKSWDIGKYDCIRIHKDARCFSKSLQIHESVITATTTLPPPTGTMSTSTSTRTHAQGTITATTKQQESEKTTTATTERSTKVLLEVELGNPTQGGGTTSLTSNTLKLLTLVFSVVLFTGET